jgi:hypothetical protein
MPTRRKQPPATKSSEKINPAKSPAAQVAPVEGTKPSAPNDSWKVKAAGFLFALILLAALWSAGVFNALFAGPKVPLPRQVDDLTLGMTLDEVVAKYPLLNMDPVLEKNKVHSLEELFKKKPSLKKALPQLQRALRSFNNDPQFGITTLKASNGLKGSTTVDLIFYLPNHKLYFISSMWESTDGANIPIEDWAHQFRRWKKGNSGSAENLGNNVTLKEWNFVDDQTEMVLRSLDYSGKVQKWQDLRDASNEAAQSAFAKYRLEAAN